MSVYGSDDVAFLLLGGYSLLGVATQFSDNKEGVFEETHVLGDSWVEQSFVGLHRGEFEQQGFFDDAALSVNAALNGGEGTSRVLCYGIEGNTKLKHFTGFAGALQVNFQRVATRGELHKANAKYAGSGTIDEGVILHQHATETAAGNTVANSHDNGSSTSNGGAGYAQVSALTLGGYTNITLVVRHSADNVTYADLIVFAAVTAAPTAERKTVAGAVNRYVAASWGLTGAGSNPSITFLIGFARY